MKPLYQHDCNSCTFLGSVEGREHPAEFMQPADPIKKADLYVCGAHEHLTVIARFSDELSDYSSGVPFAFLDDPNLFLKEVARRALCLPGYIPIFMKKDRKSVV